MEKGKERSRGNGRGSGARHRNADQRREAKTPESGTAAALKLIGGALCVTFILLAALIRAKLYHGIEWDVCAVALSVLGVVEVFAIFKLAGGKSESESDASWLEQEHLFEILGELREQVAELRADRPSVGQ
jgi:hypothetical protein